MGSVVLGVSTRLYVDIALAIYCGVAVYGQRQPLCRPFQGHVGMASRSK
jgi:hypothetical protein